jgi:ankyrin repeat protein
MMIASRNGCVPMLEMLLQHGASLSCRGPRGETLLYLAVNNDQMQAVQWLHRAGVVVHGVDMVGQSAAHVAAKRMEIEVIRYLHKVMRLDFSAEDFEGQTPLMCVPRFSQRQQGPEVRDNCKSYILYAMGVAEAPSFDAMLPALVPLVLIPANQYQYT